MECLMTFTAASSELKQSKFGKRTFYVDGLYSELTQMLWIRSLNATGVKCCLLFIEEISRKTLIKKTRCCGSYTRAQTEVTERFCPARMDWLRDSSWASWRRFVSCSHHAVWYETSPPNDTMLENLISQITIFEFLVTIEPPWASLNFHLGSSYSL